MKYIDIKDEPRSSFTLYWRWKNDFKSKCVSMLGRKIEVRYEPECGGFGSKYCAEAGEHSWFNHAMDSFYRHGGATQAGLLPEGFVEP